MATSFDEPVIMRARELFAASGKTLDEVGVAMGLEGQVARKSAWQLLNKVTDPRISTLRKFAKAIGVPITELVQDSEETRQ